MGLTKFQYHQRALANAFGDDAADWIPSRGYLANRPRIIKLYDYYRDTYNRAPKVLLWAGLGRMAGGAVVSGLDILSIVPGFQDGEIGVAMVEVGRAIFDDLAWLHEAILDDVDAALELAREQDLSRPARRSYEEAVGNIISTGLGAFDGGGEVIASGNHALLEIEQFSIIQPIYDRLRASAAFLEFFALSKTSAFTREVHPYHLDFLLSFPTTLLKDILLANDRWEWINLPAGMWEKWSQGFRGPSIGVSETERSRLVNIPLDRALRREYAPVVQELLPIGAPI